MASLDRMSISGIRSFSPDKQQQIKFFTPLTLILGPNGTGKTTIIECLRYITTGDLPPNCDRGRAFVHDPKMANETEVKAQIKLKFKDIHRDEVVTTRSMSNTQKFKTQEYKSLEGTMKRIKDGQEISLSSRCAELDREMVACFGVSKAILNNVIFCHQEDSNWPLGEGKMLKSKFDQIFAATRYIKALDSFHKLRLNHDTDARVLDSDMKLHSQNQELATKLREELDTTETRLAVSRDQVRSIQDKLKPIEDKLNEIHKVERRINDVHVELTKKETELKFEDKACRDLNSAITDKYIGSLTELQTEMKNFKSQLRVKQQERDELEETLNSLNHNYPQLANKRSQILLNIGKLNTEADQHEKSVQSRDKFIQQLAARYNLSGVASFVDPLTAAQVNHTLELMKNKIETLLSEQVVLKENFAVQEKEIQTRINVQNEKKTKLEHTETMRKQEILNNRREIDTINENLIRTQESAARLHDIGEELQKKKCELESISGQLDSSVAQREISRLQTEQSTLDSEIRQLDAEMMRLMEQVKIQAELDAARKEKASRDEVIRKLKSKHNETLHHLLGNIPVENYRFSLDQFTSQVTQEIRKLTEGQAKIGIELATSESNRKNKMEELKRKEAELRDSEERIFEIGGSQDLEFQLTQLKDSIKNLQEEKGSFTGTQHLYGKFIGKLRQADPCCPLCHRNFNDQLDVTDLINELNTKLRLLPNEMAGKQKTLEEQQLKYDAVSELRPIKSRIDVLTDGEIPALKFSIKGLSETIENGRRKLAELDEMLMLKQCDKAAADSMQSDVGLLEQNLSDVKKVERRIADISRLIGGGDRNMDIVSQEKKELQGKIDEIQDLLRTKQGRLSEYLRRTQSLQADVNRLGAEHLKISQDVQQVARLEERKVELSRDMVTYQKEIEDARMLILPIQNSIKELENEKDNLVVRREKELDAVMLSVNEARDHSKEVNNAQQSILRYVSSKREDVLKAAKQDLDAINARLEKMDKEKKDCTDKLQQLSKDLDSHQTRVRNLTDNHQLRIKEEHVQNIQLEASSLREKLGGFNIRTLQDEKKALEKNEQTLTKDRHKAQGSQNELEESIRKLRVQLNSDIYRDADKNYRQALIKLKTSRLASSDLQKYANALDSAIMQYHNVKMKEINKIIKELWAKTYKGNDMDYIEIRSDVEEISTANSASGKRKPYNYKVVMVKGNVEQGMRGRCSAGQKVLASLIIRLALAETFCLNCGILALDEPTTNLDRDNIDSLAEALSNIVQMRSVHHNFQLVVITHDEEFVERLGRSEYVDFYYRVSKDPQRGMSQVQKYSVQTL